MENTLYNDFIPSQEEIKKEYKGISKNPDKIEDLIYDGQIIEYFGLFFDDLYEIFKSEHYSPKSLNDANNYLMQNYYELDKDSEIAGVYTKKVDGKEKAFITKIGKNDFYKAYYMPIWENLSLKERAQVAKWHFDHKKDVLQSKNIKLRFIEHEDYLAYNQSFGMCMSNDYMYINNSLLFDSNPFELITTIEHEFQHINQENSSEYIIREKKDKHNLYEKIILGGTSVQNYPTPFSITKKEKDGLYLGYIMEQKAERRSLKEYKKINKANQQLFGVCEEQEQDTNKYIWNLKFRNGMLTVKQLEKSGKYTEKEIADYVTCKNRIILVNYTYFGN